MIKINVENRNSDFSSIDFKFYFNVITIGNNEFSNVLINIPKHTGTLFSLRCDKEGVFVKNLSIPYFLSNGKKVTGEKLHNVGDSFSFDFIKIKITEYDYSSIIAPIDFKNKIIERMNEPNGEELINILKQELLQLEYENNN